ncbi:MAG: stage III sporulation protein AB [Defluviitaleaceae bacterium]|nr:stage III sporulation protein AB [Defluviitaleaceae bacterium]
MILQIAGGVIIITATTLLGLHFGSMGAKRTKDLMEMKKSLIMLKSQIDFAVYTMPQAFLHIANKTEQPISDFYAGLANKLENGISVEVAWQESVDDFYKSHLHKEDTQNIAMLGTTLGAMDAGVQISSIDMLITTIDDTLAKLNTQNPKDAKMYRGLGIISGLLITIVLLH